MNLVNRIVAAGLLGVAMALAIIGTASADPKEIPNCAGQIRSYEAQHLAPNLGQVIQSFATTYGVVYGQFVASVAVSGVAPDWVEPGCV